jgi:ElaB/YqjD/DUF883 family membrane-anchored ribosome-binding protein
MKAGVLDKAIEVGAAVAQVRAGSGQMKEAVADALEDGLSAAKRAVKQGRYAAEDQVDDAEYQVKQRPFSAVGLCFGIGLALGAVIGVLLARNGHRGK